MMRNLKEIPSQPSPSRVVDLSSRRAQTDASDKADALASELATNGFVVLPELVSPAQLRDMQKAFEVRLRRIRWNNFEGYFETEPYRHMVEDVLLLDQGFLDLALHPLIKGILNQYLGADYELTEAKGWKSLPTKRDFHGWHGDSWYDQAAVKELRREIKLAMYLTDVKSGAFNYMKGSHGKHHPRTVKNHEVKNMLNAEITELAGPAGTAFLFDTSGIHRQGVPMLESRQAVFYNYHDPTVPLQQEDVDYYRYHPLLLNAAFLGDLSDEDRRILGFGNKTNFVPAFDRPDHPPALYNSFCSSFDARLNIRQFRDMAIARLKRTFGKAR